jgi:hypothetical protein
MVGEQITCFVIHPYFVDGRKKPMWRVNYDYTEYGEEKTGNVYIDNATCRRLERFKIERLKFNYLAEIINRVNE